ncbi:MAG: molybdopterin-dependent oxidoreductase, partial [Pseudomonadota bacterium]|nr:molybdopterin-dependent oxidoreductase [Pseudomonadota bacterium]
MRRRAVILSGLGAAGALVVGWGVLPPRERIGGVDAWPAAEGEVGLNGWIKIAADGVVLLAMPRSEMGQGVHTALAMLVGEELDVPLERIRLVVAGPDRLYGNVANMVSTLPFFHPRDGESGNETRAARSTRWVVAKAARELGINVTGGSSSVVDAWDVLRLAAATARARLVGAASLLWKQPADELSVVRGVVAHEASGVSAHYGMLARMAAATPPGNVVVKPRRQWSLLGTSASRIDLPAKVDGSAQFGVDVRLPGMLFAAIRHAPMLGGSPGPIDIAPALALAGVERVVRLGPYAGSTAALAVVGRTWWHAQRGAAAIGVEWRPGPGPLADSGQIVDELERRARAALRENGGFAFHRRGDIDAAEARATRRIERVYRAPYLAHAALEPLNCTARVADGRAELWVPTQVPGLAREIAAGVAGVDESAVTLHLPYLGGGFGRRLEVDVVAQAVRIALETAGRPVQLMWSREEEFGHDFYRPAAAAAMSASLDESGLPMAWRFASAGDAVTPRWMERAVPRLSGRLDTPDKTASEGLFDQPYAV